MRCIKLIIDTKNRMTFFHLKILLTVLLLVLITSCKDASKTEQQSDTTVNTDSLTSNDEKSFLFLTEWFDKVQGCHGRTVTEKRYFVIFNLWEEEEEAI